MKRELYQEIASRILARNNCIKSNNTEWKEKHFEIIEKLITMLPHGSGLDDKWFIDYDKSKPNKIVLCSSFHAMDENGYYDGWLEFTLIITPSLISGIDLHIRGNFGKYQDVKDYLYEMLYHELIKEIDTNELIN